MQRLLKLSVVFAVPLLLLALSAGAGIFRGIAEY
jgi:hypothetical protein